MSKFVVYKDAVINLDKVVSVGRSNDGGYPYSILYDNGQTERWSEKVGEHLIKEIRRMNKELNAD